MNIFDNDTKTRLAFNLSGSGISEEGSVSAFKSGDSSVMRVLETIVEPGTIINGYEVGRMLGRGGIAAVYEARHVESSREVALKILDVRFTGSAEAVSRFLAEGESLADFDHPNIVQHIDHGSDDTFVYLAMELVNGITLDQLAHSISLENHHYVHLAREISKGLTMVHAKGMVHGDIKPSNILVTRPGEVKISDFGTASRSTVAGGVRAGGNKVFGTSAYMAPELFSQSFALDYRADIYSLGVTFYKLFAGKMPVKPWVSPKDFNPELPEKLDGLLQRALQEDPDDRYVTAKEFCDALASLFDEKAPTTPVALSPDKDARAAAEAEIEQLAQLERKKTAQANNRIDWKMVALCALAAVGLAATLIALAVFYGQW